ncbi:hypothetical protein [Aeoliella straminimaris]|uniref:hypothetical protein n=1 Tax=Aeoliella straminimaris TaxID=2954799 RepID=UPI0020923630|nr:hypothetical protein [Aeoliella straminimaris]
MADEPLTLLVRRTAAQLRPWVLEAQVALTSADVFPRGERLDLARMDARRTRRMELTKHTAWIEDKHPCLAAHPPTRSLARIRNIMSLDVYVMPMWQFKAGDVESAVQQLLGGQSKVITPQGIFSPQRIKSLFARRKAKQQVRQIVAEAEKELKTTIEWQDEGDVVHSQQASWGFEALRAYAKWLDLQDHLPTFDDPPEDNFYKHPATVWDGEPRNFRFSHIIDHSCHSGYYVPCRFDRVVFVEPFQSFGKFTFYHSFGSSYALADQLRTIEPHIPSDKDSSISESTRELITAGFETLREFSAKSLEHKLPIVFWG